MTMLSAILQEGSKRNPLVEAQIKRLLEMANVQVVPQQPAPVKPVSVSVSAKQSAPQQVKVVLVQHAPAQPLAEPAVEVSEEWLAQQLLVAESRRSKSEIGAVDILDSLD